MDSAKINALLEAFCQRIGGDWLLAGGSLVVLEFGGTRATEDVDLVRLHHDTLNEVQSRTALFKEALSLGLLPEHVNSAIDYFLRRIPGWENELIEIRSGPCGRVFRPTLALFAALKLDRGTESDVEDLRQAIAFQGAPEFQEASFRRMASARALATFDEARSRLGV